MKKTKEELLKSPLIVCILAMLCCIFWGSAFPLIKLGYEAFAIPSKASAMQILFAGCRFTLAGIFTILKHTVLIIR